MYRRGDTANNQNNNEIDTSGVWYGCNGDGRPSNNYSYYIDTYFCTHERFKRSTTPLYINDKSM